MAGSATRLGRHEPSKARYAIIAQANPRRPFLHDLGHYKSQPFAFPTDRVRISFGDGDDVMEVKVWTMDRPVGTIRFSRVAGDFKCYWGSIEISRSEFLAGAMVAGSETEAIRVSKAVDGSLILRRSDSAYGVTGGVIQIVAARVVSWSRFAAATAN